MGCTERVSWRILRSMPLRSSETPPIVVRLPNWVGDVCMSLYSLQAVIATQQPVVVCARPWAKDLVEPLGPTAFMPISGRFLSDVQGLRETLKLHRQTGQSPLGLVFPDSFSSAAVFYLAGIRSVGYRDDGRSLLLQPALRKPSTQVHAVLKWWRLTRDALQIWQLACASALGEEPPTLIFNPDEANRRQVQAQLTSHRISDRPFVLLAPTATGLHKGKVKVWPHFKKLSETFISKGFTVITCPPASEREQARAATPDATMLEPLSLGAFAALAKQATLVVCNDSGVSHLAALCGARQVTVFGVTDPAVTGPWSQTAMIAGGPDGWPTLETVLDACHHALLNGPSARD